jgi:hypothetical protein
MQPKQVKLGENVLEDVETAEFRVSKPPTGKGYPSGETSAVQVTLTRKATRVPSAVGFDLVTNKDGRTKYVTGLIVLQDTETNTTYTMTLNDCYVDQWRLVSPQQQKENDPPVKEVIVIKAGDVVLNAGGKSPGFKLANFGKTTATDES